MCRSVQCKERTEFFLRILSYEMWNRVIWLVNTNVSDAHVASFFRADYDILEDTQRHENLKSREFCLRVIKFLFYERAYMSCISVLSLLIGFPTEFLMKILSAMLTLRILSPLDFAVITAVCFCLNDDLHVSFNSGARLE
jgi:hypothetical protein